MGISYVVFIAVYSKGGDMSSKNGYLK